MSAVTASFNGNSLQTSNIVLADIDHASTPDVTLNILKLAKAPRSSVASALKQQKTITLSGTIVGSSVTDCSNQIKTFKGYLVGAEKTLLVSDGSGDINYTATVNKNTITRTNYLTWAKFSTEFICSTPYGVDTSATTLVSASGRTSASYSDALTVGGNAEWQTPIITITLTAVSGATNQSIIVGNAATGQACSVTRTWAVNDVLVIDVSSLTAPVTVNGTPVVFTGALPTFNTGSQVITYNDTFTTRTFNHLVQNFQRWD